MEVLANERPVHTAPNQFWDDGSGICITNSVMDSLNGYYTFDNNLYEGLPAFYGTNTRKYLYFLRYYSQWNIGSNKGDVSIFAYCVQRLSVDLFKDITDCPQWVVWDESG